MKPSTLYFILGISQIVFANVQSTDGNQGEYVIGIFVYAASANKTISSIETVLNRREEQQRRAPVKSDKPAPKPAAKPVPKPAPKPAPKPGPKPTKPTNRPKGSCSVGKGRVQRRQCFGDGDRRGNRQSSSSGEQQELQHAPRIRPTCDTQNVRGRPGVYEVQDSRISDDPAAHNSMVDCRAHTTCDTNRQVQWYGNGGAGQPTPALNTCRNHCLCR